MNILLDLFLTFAKIGIFTFGGGYAMISMIENNCVERKQWITHDEMMNVTVIAESTPGPIAINCARLKCMGCGHMVMISRKLVEKNDRGLKKAEEKNLGME